MTRAKAKGRATKTVPFAAIDLVSEARWWCLTADVLVQALVEATQATRIEERVVALVYAVEEAVSGAHEATEKASRAFRRDLD